MSNPSVGEKICVVGLGYVGLPVAVALGRRGLDVVGFDINQRRIAELESGHDHTGEIDGEVLKSAGVRFSCDPSSLDDRTFYIVTVPTPIDDNKQPDLRPVISASRSVGERLRPGDCVVYESTVYPGVTEDICRPILAERSGLRPSIDFKVGYSPERINPGDKEHTLERIIKVVAGEDEETLERVASVYSAIVDAGVHRAPSIKVAEAAKVIENTQRDVNIALMNELALIFDRMGISTHDVLKAAGTKWNFLRFTPGLVGGHCIGVDPYYLTAKAAQLGYHCEVILSGRRINDNMGRYVAQRLVKALVAKRLDLGEVRVGVLGITFKENVPDIRNTRVIDVVAELREYGIDPVIYDPVAEAEEVAEEYGLSLSPLEDVQGLHAIVLAVPHRELLADASAIFADRLLSGGVVFDLKAALDPSTLGPDVTYVTL